MRKYKREFIEKNPPMDGIGLIPLSKGKVAQVDENDYRKLIEKNWFYHPRDGAVGKIKKDEKETTIRMHRIIMGSPKGLEIDHKNHDILDNRRCNLRICTSSQNKCNCRTRQYGKTSRYKGVFYESRSGRWITRVHKNGKQLHVGVFFDEEEAAQYYNVAAQLFYGKFACLNPL